MINPKSPCILTAFLLFLCIFSVSAPAGAFTINHPDCPAFGTKNIHSIFREDATFKEGRLIPTLTPVEITMQDTNQFHSIPGLGEFWEGLTFNSMSGDATRLYRNPDGSFNVGFILGHTAQVALDFFGAGEFKTRTQVVEVEKLSELSLHTSTYVNTDVPVLNDFLNNGGVMGMGRKLRSGLGDASTSPWLADPRLLVREHIEMFREGGSFLIPLRSYEKRIVGAEMVGRSSGLFITTRRAMDRLIMESQGSKEYLKWRLGIPKEFWNEPLVRVDVCNPLLHNARFPSGLEEGVNSLFRWGGYTRGALPEIVIDQVPRIDISVTLLRGLK